MIRVTIAFVIAPASFGLLLFGLSLFTSSASEGISILKTTALIAYPLAIFPGIPIYFLLSKLGTTGLFAYAITSQFFAVLLIIYFIIRPAYLENNADLSQLFLEARILQMLLLVFASLVTVTIFWLIARPDRMAR